MANSNSKTNMENVTVYGTPQDPETPFMTPTSTPHRVSCRLNPVRLVRQHVPLKFHVLQESENRPAENENDLPTNVSTSLNPMKTRRNKCVIKPTFALDGVGDTGNFLETKYSDADQNVIKINQSLEDCNRRSIESKCNSQGDAGKLDLQYETAVTKPCNEFQSKIPMSKNPFLDDASHDRVESSLSVAEMLKSIAAVEKDVNGIDKLVKKDLEKYREVEQEEHEMKNKETESVKEPHGKVAKDKKRNQSCKAADLNNVHAPSHECDKKKFYDPEDIRKYMMKKKHERRAKEKEEKCKKENELAAQKRKIEVTKLFTNKPKFPSYKHQDQVNDVETKSKLPKRVKNKPSVNNIDDNVPVTRKEKSLKFNPNLKKKYEYENENYRKMSVSNMTFNKSHPDFEDLKIYSNRLSYFDEARKAITKSAEGLRLPFDDEKITTSQCELKDKANHHSPNLSSDVDVFRYKNPYNFLDILKGKMNLARNCNSISESQFTTLVSSFKASSNEQFVGDNEAIDDLLRQRQQLANLHSEIDVRSNMFLKPELTLSDLTLSPDRKSATYIVDDELKSSASQYDKRKLDDELKENRRSSMEMSGVTSLASSNERSSPLVENKTIANGMRSKTTESHDNILDTAQMILQELNFKDIPCTDVIKTSSLESLNAPNVSVQLPNTIRLSSGVSSNPEKMIRKSATEPFKSLDITANLEKIFNDVDGENRLRNSLMEDDYLATVSSSTLLTDLYDQMIKSEDEKLSQILKKIQQLKESLNKHLRSEIYDLELQKNEFRESKEEDKIKGLKKKQRAVLLRITKSIMELDKMRRSVIDMVEKRKTDLLKQKLSMKDTRSVPKLKSPKSRKRPDTKNRTFLISNQTKTVFGMSASSCTSFLIEDDTNTNQIDNETVIVRSEETNVQAGEDNDFVSQDDNKASKRDSATSPVFFNSGISIRLDLNPEKILQLENSCAQVKIEACPNAKNTPLALLADKYQGDELVDGAGRLVNQMGDGLDVTKRSNCVKIKRNLSPVVFSPSKKVMHRRRQSSGSDGVVLSLNETSTTDQSDLEVRISALQEQLRQRKLEADRLRKEEKKIRKEKLRTKEQSLIKQIEAYENYIKQTSQRIIEEENKIQGISRPLIKAVTVRRHGSEQSLLKFDDSTAVENHDGGDCEEDLETNTDSERPLIKADSGILIESEATEPSERIEVEDRGSESRLQGSTSSPLTEIQTEVSIPQPPSAGRTPEKSRKFLQLVNDLQSEVFSLSEQLYSSDFVEDIAEDMADTKSEVSENVTNENNTSMSIEEILSDHRSDTSDRLGQVVEPSTKTDQVGTVELADSDKTIVSRCEVDDDSPNAENVVPVDENVCSTKSETETGLFNVKNISDIESLEEAVRLAETSSVVGRDAEDADFRKADERLMENASEVDADEEILEELAGTSENTLEYFNPRNESENSNVEDVADDVKAGSEDVDTFIRDITEDTSTPKQVMNVEISVKKNGLVKESPVVKATNFITEFGAEETDISESLEYDGGVQKSISEELDGVVRSAASNDDDKDNQKTVKTVSVASSKEEDRSLEEMMEDHSLPNNVQDTFVFREIETVSDLESVGSPVVSLPLTEPEELEEKGGDDSDMKITEAETPFLEALRREGGALMATDTESVHDLTEELVDSLIEQTYANLVNLRAEKSEGVEQENVKGAAKNNTEDLRNDTSDQTEISTAAKEVVSKMNEKSRDKAFRFREEEELRLQQMKIEKEIEELQAQQNIPPYIYLREIPNKPPPPYTPPVGQLVRVPSNEAELHQTVKPIIDYVCEQLEKDVAAELIIQAPANGKNSAAREASTYKRFLFDLTKEIACDLMQKNKPKQCLPWHRPATLKVCQPKLEGQRLRDAVEKKMSELFALRPKMHQENLIIQWSRKRKTDFVDDLLIQELQEEEAEWTNYEEDELIIKNKITCNLLEELIEDTTAHLQDAFLTKQQLANKS